MWNVQRECVQVHNNYQEVTVAFSDAAGSADLPDVSTEADAP